MTDTGKVFTLRRWVDYDAPDEGPTFSTRELAEAHAKALDEQEAEAMPHLVEHKWEVYEEEVLDEAPYLVRVHTCRVVLDSDGVEIQRDYTYQDRWSYNVYSTDVHALPANHSVYASNYGRHQAFITAHGMSQESCDEKIQKIMKQAQGNLRAAIKRKENKSS